MSCEDICTACRAVHTEHDRCSGVSSGCRCIDMEHDYDPDDGHGDTQWADPGEAGGYEGAEW